MTQIIFSQDPEGDRERPPSRDEGRRREEGAVGHQEARRGHRGKQARAKVRIAFFTYCKAKKSMGDEMRVIAGGGLRCHCDYLSYHFHACIEIQGSTARPFPGFEV